MRAILSIFLILLISSAISKVRIYTPIALRDQIHDGVSYWFLIKIL